MNLTKRVLKGSLTLLLMRLFLRSVGLVSTLILARILSPEDFGIVTLASSVVFLFDILSETGTIKYIIQKDQVTADDLNTAWSIGLLLKLVVWSIFILLIPYICVYLESQELKAPLYTISLILPISGLMNPGMYLYQKELNFGPLFKSSVIDKTISFLVAVSLAIYIKNFWAMIIAVMVSYITKTVLSFYLHSFRPKFSLDKFSEQWEFSKWMLFRGILGYIRAQFDTVMVSKSFGLSILGGYDMMKGLSAMPAQDVIVPATQPLLSSFAKIKNNTSHLAYQMRLSLFVIFLVIFPLSCFITLHHELIVKIILGDKWLRYSELLGIMAVLLFTFSLASIYDHALTATGNVKVVFYYNLFSLIFIISLLLLINYVTVREFTYFRCAFAIITLTAYSLAVNKILSVGLLHLLKLTSPLILTCFISGLCSLTIAEELMNQPLLSFFVTPIVFFSSFIVSTLCLYVAMQQNEEVKHVKTLLIEVFSTIMARFSK